jgi:DNA-directed RNA polymerase specialized sigma24 family protein
MARRERRGAVSKPRGPGHGTERHDAVRAALVQLTPEQRLICIWRKVGFSEIEIANHLGCPTRRVAVQFSRASAALRRAAQALDARRSI